MAVDDTTTVDDATTVEPETSAEVEDKSTEDKDIDLEDIEVDIEDESEDEADGKSNDEPDEETDTDSEQEADEADKSDEETEEEAEPELSDEDKQKQHNKEMFEKRVQEKQAREATVKKQQEEYVLEGEDPRDTAVRQLQVDAYNNKVEGNTNKLTNGYQQALKDFDILSDKTPEIQAELNAALDAFQAMYVTIDDYGNPYDVRGDIYQYLQTKADSIKQLTGIGARQQVASKTKEKSKVIATPSRSPKEPKVDPDLAAFDEEADKW